MRLTKETLKQIIKEELQNAIEESEFKSAPFAAKVHHEKHKTDISPLVDKYQTDHDYSAPQYLDDIMAVAPQLTREQAIAIAELFSSEVGMEDDYNSKK